MRYTELLHPDERGRLEALGLGVPESETPGLKIPGPETPGSPSKRLLHKDGSVRWLERHLTRLREGDRVVHIAVFTDMTERVHIEEALRASEECLRLTVESVGDYAILSVDAEGCISSWNSGAGQLFGYREAEVRGRAFDLLFCAEDRAAGVPERELRDARERGIVG